MIVLLRVTIYINAVATMRTMTVSVTNQQRETTKPPSIPELSDQLPLLCCL
jgi:hypothetical protein